MGCEFSKTRGNGRAVRNVIEAGIRAMARRLVHTPTPPALTQQDYIRMKSYDFDNVTDQLVRVQLNLPCSANGEVARLTHSVNDFFGMLQNLPAGSTSSILSRMLRLLKEVELVKTYPMQNLVQLAEGCSARLATLKDAIVSKVTQTCTTSGIFDAIVQKILEHQTSPGQVEQYANLLKRAIQDQNYLLQLLQHVGGSVGTVEELAQTCDNKVAEISAMPFNSLLDLLLR